MAREDVEFKTADGVTLRGWLYKPESGSTKGPCLVMHHGFSALKEMDLDTFAEYFTKRTSYPNQPHYLSLTTK
jgi:cephalosporin-C deacetylase-like acetyl esterase